MNADIQYLNLVQELLETRRNPDGTFKFEPTRAKFLSTGQNAHAIKTFGKTFEFDLREGLPILTTKKMFWKSAIQEIIWIYVKGSNKVADLGNGIWDEWAKEDGTIGLAYGYQARRLFDNRIGREIDQVANILYKLRNDPQDRGMIINLWNVADLPYMALRPCAFQTIWYVEDNEYLNCHLIQRSADLPVGVPFNFLQYAVLTHMFAHVTGLKPGRLKHDMTNVHIYENQIEPIFTQFNRKPYNAPKFLIDPSVTNFDDFRIEHFELDGYKSHGYIDMGEIAV